MAKEIKAAKMLGTSKSVAERAESFLSSIKRNIQKNVIDQLIEKIEKLDDTIFSLSDFSLATDKNKGVSAISREDAEERFTKLIEAEYDKELLTRELEIKKASFDAYFEEQEVEETKA